jgi:hypothetical protein
MRRSTHDPDDLGELPATRWLDPYSRGFGAIHGRHSKHSIAEHASQASCKVATDCCRTPPINKSKSKAVVRHAQCVTVSASVLRSRVWWGWKDFSNIPSDQNETCAWVVPLHIILSFTLVVVVVVVVVLVGWLFDPTPMRASRVLTNAIGKVVHTNTSPDVAPTPAAIRDLQRYLNDAQTVDTGIKRPSSKRSRSCSTTHETHAHDTMSQCTCK